MDNYANGKKPVVAVKTCERCGNNFECNNADIQNCDCHAIKITCKQTDNLSASYKDCLCMKCLQELSLNV